MQRRDAAVRPYAMRFDPRALAEPRYDDVLFGMVVEVVETPPTSDPIVHRRPTSGRGGTSATTDAHRLGHLRRGHRCSPGRSTRRPEAPGRFESPAGRTSPPPPDSGRRPADRPRCDGGRDRSPFHSDDHLGRGSVPPHVVQAGRRPATARPRPLNPRPIDGSTMTAALRGGGDRVRGAEVPRSPSPICHIAIYVICFSTA